jgi:FkbM family methyltransferase
MKNIIFYLMHYASAFKIRFQLWLEINKAKREGFKFNFNVWSKMWAEPGVHEEFIWLTRFIPNSTEVVLLDIGGNSGYWNQMFRMYYPNTKSIGFEPVKKMFDAYFQRFKNNPDVEIYNTALGSEQTKKSINVAKDYGLTSFFQYDDYLEEKNVNFIQSENVEMDLLDNYYDNICKKKDGDKYLVVKIDVQGYECEVLKGASKVLSLFDIAIIECSFINEFKGSKPSFPTLCEMMQTYDLYPIQFGCFDYNIGPIGYERNVLFVKSNLFEKVWNY